MENNQSENQPAQETQPTSQPAPAPTPTLTPEEKKADDRRTLIAAIIITLTLISLPILFAIMNFISMATR